MHLEIMAKLIFFFVLCFEIRVSLCTLGWLSTQYVVQVLAGLELKAFSCLSAPCARIMGVSYHIYHLTTTMLGSRFPACDLWGSKHSIDRLSEESTDLYANREDVLEVSFILWIKYSTIEEKVQQR